MRIILIGIQGSGKSTQGKLLAAKFNVPYLSTGDIFRALAKQDTTQGKQVKQLMTAGILIPDEEVIPLIQNYLSQEMFTSGYILDGFPRTLAQAQAFTQQLNAVVYLRLSDEEALRRIASRTDTRDDETTEAIKKRIELFHGSTKPVIAYYQDKQLLIEINGEQSRQQVFEDTVKALV